MSKIFNRQNLILLLLITLIAHNFYLQKQVEDAVRYARRAASDADDAADFARLAASEAEDGAEFAKKAASYASSASDYAYDAYRNSFGKQCWSCP